MANLANPGRELVIVESPLSGATDEEVALNLRFARACALLLVRAGYAPFASHLLYTQFLSDSDPNDRRAGIECGLSWAGHEAVRKTFVFTDLGITDGMQQGIHHASRHGREVIFRKLADHPRFVDWRTMELGGRHARVPERPAAAPVPPELADLRVTVPEIGAVTRVLVNGEDVPPDAVAFDGETILLKWDNPVQIPTGAKLEVDLGGDD